MSLLQPPRVIRTVCLTLLSLGVLSAGYLLFRSFALLDGRLNGGIDLCSAVFNTNCDEALQNDIATQLGIPLAGWAVVFYVSVATLVILGWSLGDSFEPEAGLGAFVLTVLGVVVSMVLLAATVGGRLPFCPLCLVMHAINLLLACVCKKMTGRSFRELFSGLVSGFAYLAGKNVSDPQKAAWKVVGFLVVGLVAVITFQWVFVQSELRTSKTKSIERLSQALLLHAFTPRVSVPIDESRPHLGSVDAPVRLVVFSSFQCPGCAILATEIQKLRRSFSKSLVVQFRHFPLSSQCNSQLTINAHPQACTAAMAAEAAYQQGKFWDFHDALFAGGPSMGDKVLRQIATNVNLDGQQFEQLRSSLDVQKSVEEDIALGNQLGITATPTVFLNGKIVRRLSADTLKLLIIHELAASQRKENIEK